MSSSLLDGNQRDRNQFLVELVTGLASTLQYHVGLNESEGFIKQVGMRVGDAIRHDYERTKSDGQLSAQQLAEILVDLKRKIDGGFSVESIESTKIVLVNDRCPFGNHVRGVPSLCQMTSSVFGKIASEHFGYARIEIKQSIAKLSNCCRVVIHLEEPPVHGILPGSEYFGSGKAVGD